MTKNASVWRQEGRVQENTWWDAVGWKPRAWVSVLFLAPSLERPHQLPEDPFFPTQCYLLPEVVVLMPCPYAGSAHVHTEKMLSKCLWLPAPRMIFSRLESLACKASWKDQSHTQDQSSAQNNDDSVIRHPAPFAPQENDIEMLVSYCPPELPSKTVQSGTLSQLPSLLLLLPHSPTHGLASLPNLHLTTCLRICFCVFPNWNFAYLCSFGNQHTVIA